MDINTLRIILTLAGFVLFIGIIAWAVSPSNRRRFEEAAQIPLDDSAPSARSGSA